MQLSIIIGRIGFLDIKETDKRKFVKLSVGVSKNFKDHNEWQRKTDWYNVFVFKEHAIKACSHLKVGDLIYVEGSFDFQEILKKDGSKSKYFSISAKKIQKLASKHNNKNLSDEIELDDISKEYLENMRAKW